VRQGEFTELFLFDGKGFTHGELAAWRQMQRVTDDSLLEGRHVIAERNQLTFGARPWIATLVLIGFAALVSCTTYEPAPAPPPSPFDRAWSAALGAAQDEGVRITSEDRVNGVIRGYRDQQEVAINIRTQADGNVRLEMSARGPKGSDTGLAGRISRAYDRRMGR
jgi:hypothetical protein